MRASQIQPAPCGAPLPRASHPSIPTLVRALGCIDVGDQCAERGDRERALMYYGRALDEFLREGCLVIASSVAQRMVERYPDVVRARMTLAVLGLTEELRAFPSAAPPPVHPEMERYLSAALNAGQQALAARALRQLADATESPVLRERFAEMLGRLRDFSAAEAVFVAAREEQHGIRQPLRLPGDQPTRWVHLLLQGASG